MVDQYFAGMEMTEEVKKRFDLLIKAIDRKNKILTDYNGVVVDIATARLEIHEQETLIAGLGSGKAALNDDEIQFVALFMSRAYENMGRFAIRALYSRVRAFNCVSFSPSRAFDCLSPLNSFSAVTASTLQVAVKSALQKDFQEMQARWAETSSNSKTVTMTMSEAEHPILFQQFRSKRSILFDIDWDMFRLHVGDDAAWDIRLLRVSVYLVGAKVDRSKLPPNPPSSLTTVQLHVSTTGMFRFRDRSYKTHVFELAPSHTSFFHKDIPAENPPDTASGKPVKGESFQLDFLEACTTQSLYNHL